MRLGFTEEFSLTEERLRANLSVTGGQLTTVAQQVAGQNRNWNVTITPNQLETVTITLATTGDCDDANAICAWAGKPLTDTFTVSIPHYVIPRVTDVTVTGGPGQNGAWDTGETATIEVRFNKAVTVSGLPGEEPALGILIGGTRRQAAYAGGSGSDALTFSHPVTAEDAGTTSVEVVDNGITLGETGIADSHGQAAVLTFDYYTYLSTTAPPIRALFKGLPASHGESGFTFELTFSEAPDNLSYLTLQGDDENPGLLSVTNAVVDGVRPLETGQSRRWEVTVTPSGADPVTITLAANRNCAEASAICKDARRLAGPVTATVIGRASTGNTAATGAPTITGTAGVGETLTANTSGISDSDGTENATFAYQWLADDIAISGATGSTYTLSDAEEGRTIKVRVSFTDDAGNEETLTSAATAAVSPEPTDRPHGLRASGDADAVTLNWSAPDAADNVTMYRILRHRPEEGEPEALVYVEYTHSRATSHTDTEVEGGVLYVYQVQAVDIFGFVGEASGPASVRVPVLNTPATGAPAISGTAQVGETLTASTSGISDSDGLAKATFAYQWLADDTDIAGATGSAYTLADAEEGKAIKVRVSFTDDAGNEETLTSTATAAVEAALTAEQQDVPGSHDGSGTFTFRILFSEPVTAGYATLKEHSFQVSNATIKKAQRVDGQDDLRKFTVQPSFRCRRGPGATRLPSDCSDEGAICTSDGKRLSTRLEITVPGPAPANSAATGTPAISGTPEAGQPLTASTSGISDADGLTNATFGYQWIANDGTADTDIQDATASTYPLTDADVGKTIRVRVSFTDDAGNEETLTSTATDAVEAAPAPNSPATGSPTITGAAQVGETLTASTPGIADVDGLTNATFSYQWLADDTDIAGATGSSYTLTDSDEGKSIKVRVFFTDDAGNEETLTSTATDAVEAAPAPNSPATGSPTITGAAQVGETLTASTSGIEDDNGLDSATFSIQWLADDTGIAGATGSSYTLTDSDEGKIVSVKVSFTDDAGHAETLTSAATAAVEARPLPPLTASLENVAARPTTVRAAFTFELRFSEDFSLGYKTLRDHAFTVSGGEVRTKARRLEKGSNVRLARSRSRRTADGRRDRGAARDHGL